jgi:hypothetical protein
MASARRIASHKSRLIMADILPSRGRSVIAVRA